MEYDLNVRYAHGEYEVVLKPSGTWVTWLILEKGKRVARSNTSYLRAEDAYLSALSYIERKQVETRLKGQQSQVAGVLPE